LIKKIFEDYANLKKTGNSDMVLIRQYLGDANVVERVASLCQENKFLQGFIGKIRYKMRLQPTAPINEIEAALGIY
jgi:tRNA isopentenyl-2-thiomethyl-A-37 hydroxylase MiaE